MTFYVEPQWQPTPPPSRKRVWPWLAFAAALLGVAGIFVLVFATAGSSTSGAGAPRQANLVNTTTALHDAYATCGAGTLADKDHTLLIDMAGEDYDSGDATMGEVQCVLGELGAPQSVLAQMGATRALDGMQTATWTGVTASWTYHPDAGLDLILTQTD
jgi:hypothetical protein